MTDVDRRWVVRLFPAAGRTLEDLLRSSYSLDVWERNEGFLVVSAPESSLRELERRRLARVERICPTDEFARRAAELPIGER
jgi:hypothetical protein